MTYQWHIEFCCSFQKSPKGWNITRRWNWDQFMYIIKLLKKYTWVRWVIMCKLTWFLAILLIINRLSSLFEFLNLNWRSLIFSCEGISMQVLGDLYLRTHIYENTFTIMLSYNRRQLQKCIKKANCIWFRDKIVSHTAVTSIQMFDKTFFAMIKCCRLNKSHLIIAKLV